MYYTEWVITITLRLIYLLGNSRWYPRHIRLVELQNRSEVLSKIFTTGNGNSFIAFYPLATACAACTISLGSKMHLATLASTALCRVAWPKQTKNCTNRVGSSHIPYLVAWFLIGFHLSFTRKVSAMAVVLQRQVTARQCVLRPIAFTLLDTSYFITIMAAFYNTYGYFHAAMQRNYKSYSNFVLFLRLICLITHLVGSGICYLQLPGCTWRFTRIIQHSLGFSTTLSWRDTPACTRPRWLYQHWVRNLAYVSGAKTHTHTHTHTHTANA
jgi:hypothetical protein